MNFSYKIWFSKRISSKPKNPIIYSTHIEDGGSVAPQKNYLLTRLARQEVIFLGCHRTPRPLCE